MTDSPMLTPAALDAAYRSGSTDRWGSEDVVRRFLAAQDRDALALIVAKAAAARDDEGNGYAGRPWDDVTPGMQSVYVRLAEVCVAALLGPVA